MGPLIYDLIVWSVALTAPSK